MKIYTATFYKNNYGSALQAFALHQKLRELGAEPVIIHYKEKPKKRSLVTRLREFFKPEKHYGPIRKLRRYLQRKRYADKAKRINRFVTENTTMQPYEACVAEIEKEPCVLLAGSDQVWNTLNRPIAGFYLFDFVKNTRVRRVSYAASIGLSQLSPEQKAYYKKTLEPFAAVSLRERNAYESLKDVLDNPVVRQDVDPTLLFDGAFWEKVAGERPESEPYLFVYMLRPDKRVMRIARRLAKQNGLKIIYMGLYANRYHGVKTIPDAGVEQFLAHIRYADRVVTNSFHGTVFSVLFERKFVSVRLSTTASRAENLLSMTELSNHLIDRVDRAEVANEDYDVNRVRALLKEKREDSVAYLRDIITKS